VRPSWLSWKCVMPRAVIRCRSSLAFSASESSPFSVASSASAVSSSRVTPLATSVAKSDCTPERGPERRKMTSAPPGTTEARVGSPAR
jgi:hypothetical protein